MPYLIGIDEAGYSPNLGPLVIAATVWRINDWSEGDDLYKRLKRIVSKAPVKSPVARGKPRRVAIADSKALYSPQAGLGHLERGVLAALGQIGLQPSDWREIWATLNDDDGHFHRQPWHAEYDTRLPLAADVDDLVALGPFLTRGMEAAGARLIAIKSAAVFPELFNDCSDRFGNKGETLSKLTLRLLASALELCQGDWVDAVCDRHGGRARYGRLLQQQFTEPLVEVRQETSTESIYGWDADSRRVTVRFCVGGESYLPVALASMTAKYMRELAMRAFNDFWRRRVPDLKPTAGYPGDSRRFKQAIGATQVALGIDDRILWRPPMILTIVRHGHTPERDPAKYPDDALRPLTKVGRKRFAKMLKQLAEAEFRPMLVATSPLVRCHQTAKLVAERVVPRPKVVELSALAPGSDLKELIKWTNRQKVDRVAWVGHSPDVEQMVAALLGCDQDAIRMAKGAIAAIDFSQNHVALEQGQLRWLVSPAALGY